MQCGSRRCLIVVPESVSDTTVREMSSPQRLRSNRTSCDRLFVDLSQDEVALLVVRNFRIVHRSFRGFCAGVPQDLESDELAESKQCQRASVMSPIERNTLEFSRIEGDDVAN